MEIRDVEDSTINWANYIFNANLGNKIKINIDLKKLSKLPDDSQQLEVESQDSLVLVNIRSENKKRITYISTKLSNQDQDKLIELLKEYRDYFAWNYDELLGLERNLVEHKLPTKPGYKLVKQ